MTSNYPPGVSGHEPQISGPDAEFDEERQCLARGIDVKTITDYGLGQIEQAILDLHGQEPNRMAVTARLYSALGDVEHAVVDETCPFSGVVTVTAYGGSLTWVCPLCRREHEEEHV